MSRSLWSLVFVATLILSLSAQLAHPTPATTLTQKNRTTYLLRTSVMGAAGYPGTSPQFATNGTLAQSTPIGIGTRADKKLHAGFWYAFRSLIGPTGVDAPEPLVNRLFQNYPNPFNPATNISFTVAEENPVSLNVYNLLGARVCSLIHEWKLPGSYRVVWDGRDDTGKSVASGVYFYRLDIGDFRSVKKMLILK